jgi:DNA-binding NarL/FixJ family response regulator
MELLSPPVSQLAVAVADGQRLFAEGLGRALRAQADLDISDECATTGRAILRCVARRKPDVALIDFWIARHGWSGGRPGNPQYLALHQGPVPHRVPHRAGAASPGASRWGALVPA